MSRFRIPLANGRSYNPPPTRIDARPQNDPATAAGMRNVHRDTRGNVIAGVTAEGRKIGSGGGAPATATPRLDAGVQTPRLDSNPRQPVMSPGQRLAGRQSLFRDMQAAGRGGITPEMERRAADLGVPGSRFREVAGRINPAPASIAAVDQAPQSPARSAFRAPMLPPGSPAPKAAEPAAPSLVEGAKALRDIGTILAARKPLEVAGPPAGAAPVAKAGAPVNFTPPPSPRPLHSVGEPATPAPAPAATQAAQAPPKASVFRSPTIPSGSTRMNATFEASPQARDATRGKEVAAHRKSKRDAYNEVWNSQPDTFPSLGPDSGVNKAAKSLRTFFSGHSY